MNIPPPEIVPVWYGNHIKLIHKEYKKLGKGLQTIESDMEIIKGDGDDKKICQAATARLNELSKDEKYKEKIHNGRERFKEKYPHCVPL